MVYSKAKFEKKTLSIISLFQTIPNKKHVRQMFYLPGLCYMFHLDIFLLVLLFLWGYQTKREY
jgi:hypothetical protein